MAFCPGRPGRGSGGLQSLQLRADHPLPVDRLQPRVPRRRLFLLDESHVPVESHLVLINLQLPAQDASGAEELILVRPALGARQAVEPSLVAMAIHLLRLHEHLAGRRVPDNHEHDVDNTLELPANLRERGFAADQLSGKLLDCPGSVLAEPLGVDAERLQVRSQCLLVEADGRPHERRDCLGGLRLELHLLRLRLPVGHPVEELGVALPVGLAPLRECGEPNLLEQGLVNR
mmetsp:Transcript_63033/g.184879  ORF Transcript_63033/g.184879 Transcript_63033/m.184879 type:complete len:232 (+) Transcript_63033:118-813(+)